MNKILMISYHYYPDQEVGAQRVTKFAKYLPRFDWIPVILSVDTKYYPRITQDANQTGFEIHRTGKWPLPDDIYLNLKTYIKRSPEKKQSEKTSVEPGDASVDDFTVHDTPLWKRFIYSLSWTPDDKAGWVVPGMTAAIRLARRDDIDIIFSTGPPWTSHLVALAAKKLSGKKWIADFRDPWTIGITPPQFNTGLSRWIGRFMERKVVRNADHIITTTPELKDAMVKQYASLLEEKCTPIYNGYDEDDFISIPVSSEKITGQISFLHAGTLYMGRDPYNFIRALGELVEEESIDKKQMRVDFYGHISININRIRYMMAQYHLQDRVEFHSPVDRAGYLKLLAESDILVLLQSSMAFTQVPGKTFEYLAARKIILALAPQGATSNLLAQFDHVRVADINDMESIKMAVKSVIDLHKKTESADIIDKYKIEGFNKLRLTESLSLLLNAMVGKKRGRD